MEAPFKGKRLADMRLLMHAIYRCRHLLRRSDQI